MRIFSIIVVVLLVLMLVLFGVYIIVLRIFFHKAFGRRKIIKRLEEKKDLINDYKIDLCWLKEKRFSELKIVSEDGLKLYGYFLENNPDKIAIIVHGYGCDYKEMSSYAKMFFNMGYSIFTLQSRGHGKSEGFTTMGCYEKFDILSWINVFVSKNPKVKIVLFGLSMGGASVLLTSGLDLPKNVICTISDCAYQNVYNQIKLVYNPKNKKIKNVILEHFNKYMQRAYGINLKQIDTKESLKKSQIPVMIIHGKNDKYVPVEDGYEIFQSLPKFKGDSYFVDNANHAMSYAKNPRMYENKVREFLKKWGM